MFGLVLVQASLIVVGIIYGDVTLAIFGLGIPPPQPDIGVMLFASVQYLGIYDYQLVIPAIILALMMLAFTFAGDGVRDAFDPRMNA